MLCSAVSFGFISADASTIAEEDSPGCSMGMYGECNNGSSIQFIASGSTCADAYSYGTDVIYAFCINNGGVHQQ